MISGLPPSLEGAASKLELGGLGASTSVLQTRNTAERQAAIVREFLVAEGYLAADVETAPITEAADLPTLVARPGARFNLSSVELSINGEIDAEVQRALDNTAARLAVGAPARTSDIEATEADLLRVLRQSGHAFAESIRIDAVASRRDATLDVTFFIDAGPLVKLGALRTAAIDDTRPEFFAALKTWTDGAIYRPATIDRLRTRLRSSGIFDGIGVELARQPEPDGNHPVILRLVEAKRRSIGAGVTASTADGVGADAFWERRNLTGRGDKLRVSAEVATISRALSTRYERPNIGRFGRTFSAEAGVRAQETIAFDLQGAKIAASLAQPFNRWFSVSASAVVDATRTKDLRARFIGLERDLVTIALPLTATYATVTEPLDPQRGIRAFTSVENGVSFGDARPGYTRVQISGATYRKIAEDIVVAGRANFGSFSGSDDVPIDRLFFAGGGGSVRGYEFQSLSPKDFAGNIVGGRSIFDASVELRWRQSPRFGYAVFVDGGAAAASSSDVFGDLRVAAGAGLRYYPGFGPIRFDIASPINPRPGDSPVQVYVSIGQAF